MRESTWLESARTKPWWRFRFLLLITAFGLIAGFGILTANVIADSSKNFSERVAAAPFRFTEISSGGTESNWSYDDETGHYTLDKSCDGPKSQRASCYTATLGSGERIELYSLSNESTTANNAGVAPKLSWHMQRLSTDGKPDGSSKSLECGQPAGSLTAKQVCIAARTRIPPNVR